MKKKDKLVSEILNTFNKARKIKGHFSEEVIDLGNGKHGIDIFYLTKKKTKDGKSYLYLSGLYKYGVIMLLQHMGIFYLKEHVTFILIKKEENIIYEITLKEIKDLINEYLKQLPELSLRIDEVEGIFTTEAQIEIFYRQTNIVLNDKFLEFLKKEESPIIRDTSDKCSLFFENGIIEIDQGSIVKSDYKTLNDGLVWKNNIIKFQIENKDSNPCHFSKFISNVCNDDPKRIFALRSAIGYLIHSFHRKSGGQMVILYDESITDINNPQGGTGKGVIANSIATLRATVKIDGKKFKGDNRFDFQDVDFSTRLLWLDDVGKYVDIDRFNSISTDGFNAEKKFKDSIFIPPEDAPKILICSNIILDCTGTTRLRRQFIIELSNHYSSKIASGVEEPIVKEHNCQFFTKDWDNEEWNRFYWYMIDCVQLFLKNGLIPVPTINMIENRSKQVVGEELYNWIKSKSLLVNKDYDTRKHFEEYRDLYEAGNGKFTQRNFSNKLKKYATLNDQSITFLTSSTEGEKVSCFRISN
jgi:hypothetical protein